MSFSDLLHYLRIGGFTLAFLLLASVVAMGVAIERLIALWGVSERSRALGDTVHKHLLRGDLAAARTATERSDAAVADIFLAGFDRFERTRGNCDGVDSAVERERAQVGLRLRRNLWLLATIGSLTPFVGLFGTVAGIMRSFKDLGLDVTSGGTGGTAAVMTGISEALVATAVGLAVAIPAVVAFNVFNRQLKTLTSRTTALGHALVGSLRAERSPSTPRAVASGEAR
jgi:biopolymer transport protein ExbB/TolQ